MPSALLARIDLDALYPPFAYKIIELTGILHDAGHDYYATEGFRTPEHQEALWQQGRNTAGAVIEPSKVVTYLRWGLHNCSIAVDFVLDTDLNKPGIQPSWHGPDYEPLALAAESLKLEAGAHWKSFKDCPHVQLPIDTKGISGSKLRQLEQIHGMKGVWDYLDKFGPW